METKEILNARGKTYGQYCNVSKVSQDIKTILRNTPNYYQMPPPMQESLDMIANKISRIVNGNALYDDSWRDIAGYATLVLMEIEEMEKHDAPDTP